MHSDLLLAFIAEPGCVGLEIEHRPPDRIFGRADEHAGVGVRRTDTAAGSYPQVLDTFNCVGNRIDPWREKRRHLMIAREVDGLLDRPG